jgi:hypothetical protein
MDTVVSNSITSVSSPSTPSLPVAPSLPGVIAELSAAVGAPASHGKLAAPEELSKDSPIDQLYKQFAKTFGNSNPAQLFSLVFPGTLLNREDYINSAKPGEPIPPLLEIAQSALFDMHYPIAAITQADGTKVSDRYRQALETYGPKPNEKLIDLQRVIRSRLDQQTTIDVDGEQRTVSLLEKFDILQERWIAKKEAWGRMKADKLEYYRTRGDADWYAQFVRWYENVAGGYVAGIDASYNRMLADFPVTELEDALAILDTHDAAALLRAKEDVRNAPVPVPDQLGAEFYPAQAMPSNWGNALATSSTFRDMLAAPDAQMRYLNMCVDQLSDQIFAWNALLAQLPSSDAGAIAGALDEFNRASAAYTKANDEMVGAYGDNVVLAVKTYMQYKQGTEAEKAAGADSLAKKLNPAGKSFDYGKVAEAINNANKLLTDKTSGMVLRGEELGQAATKYLEAHAGEGLADMMQPVIAKLQTQLARLQQQMGNIDASASRTIQILTADAAKLGGGQFATVADTDFSERWSEFTFQISTEAMKTASEASTQFSQTNWGVNFFFGSAGGKSTSMTEQFAQEYMDDKMTIQIGLLATKVVIQRPWMHAELLGHTNNYFKAIDAPVLPAKALSKDELVPGKLGGTVDLAKANENCQVLGNAILPGYPVALLLVKDVTIKMSCKSDKTSALQKHSESNSSSGGGFLCFSVSRSQAETSDSKALNSYAMAGDFMIRLPAPQIAGVWNQILPMDKSAVLNKEDLERVIQFRDIHKVAQALRSIKRHGDTIPPAPDA